MTAVPFAATSTSTDPQRLLEAAEPRERTPWLLAIMCLLVPILPSFSVFPGPLKGNGAPERMIAVVLFGLVLLGFLVVRRTASMRTIRPGVVIILVYFLLETAIWGAGLTHLGSALVESGKTDAILNPIATVGPALYIIMRVRTTRQRNIVLGCLATGLAFACLVGLLQWLANIDLRFFFEPPGFVKNLEDLEMETRLGATRVVGTSSHPVEFSVLAAATVPLTLYLARNAIRREARWAAGLACALALVCIPAAVSRTGIIALAAALFVYMWNFKARDVLTAIGAAAVAVWAYTAVFPSVANALWQTILHSEEDPSILARTADYAMVGDTFRAHPIFGLGLGASPPTEYGFLDNEWLQAIVQGGIVGVAAMVVLAGGGFFGVTAALRAATNSREREQAYMLGAVFVAVLISSFTFDLFSFRQAAVFLFIVFGLLWSSFTVAVPENRTAPTGPSRAVA